MLLLVAIFIPVMSSCGDDEEELSGSALESYIIGNWHSYKATVTAYGESNTVTVSKTGDYSALYMECTVESGGNATYRYWMTDNNGMTHWTEEQVRYIVRGDIVTLTDSDGESADLTYEPSSRNMIMQMNFTEDGISYSTKLYFKK